MSKKIFQSVSQLVGNTPLLKLNNLIKNLSLKANLLVKLESFNPAGSSKDRVAMKMIEEYEKQGLINKDTLIIEPTSGNTGIGLACACASKGYKAVIVMPDTMSKERCLLIKAYGAELVLTDGALGMKGAIEKAEEIKKKNPNSIIAGQFTNPANVLAHYTTTGPEIFNDLGGEVDIFVAGVGTGGTITGVGKYLKERISNIKIVAVEPFNSPLLSKGVSGSHNIQGIGANFIPQILDTTIYDEVFTVKEVDAYNALKTLAREEGILAGISSGASLFVGIQLAKMQENEGKTIVVLLPDTGDRYLSTEAFN